MKANLLSTQNKLVSVEQRFIHKMSSFLAFKHSTECIYYVAKYHRENWNLGCSKKKWLSISYIEWRVSSLFTITSIAMLKFYTFFLPWWAFYTKAILVLAPNSSHFQRLTKLSWLKMEGPQILNYWNYSLLPTKLLLFTSIYYEKNDFQHPKYYTHQQHKHLVEVFSFVFVDFSYWIKKWKYSEKNKLYHIFGTTDIVDD